MPLFPGRHQSCTAWGPLDRLVRGTTVVYSGAPTRASARQSTSREHYTMWIIEATILDDRDGDGDTGVSLGDSKPTNGVHGVMTFFSRGSSAMVRRFRPQPSSIASQLRAQCLLGAHTVKCAKARKALDLETTAGIWAGLPPNARGRRAAPPKCLGPPRWTLRSGGDRQRKRRRRRRLRNECRPGWMRTRRLLRGKGPSGKAAPLQVRSPLPPAANNVNKRKQSCQ